PQRRRKAEAKLKAPELAAFAQITSGTGEREISTTMALVRGMNLLLRDKQLYYRGDQTRQALQQGISEAGGMASWMAAATSYSISTQAMLPFFIYYSMFGFQRIGDLCWASGDMRARGFLVGGTAGRTTLNGEGLQHEDGHSHLMAGAI